MEHSALPFRIELVGKTTYRAPDQDDYAIRSTNGPAGITVGIVFGGWRDGEGNADLIARAVNAHTALVAACRAMVESLHSLIKQQGVACTAYCELEALARGHAALALAEPQGDPYTSPIGQAMIAAGATPITLAEPQDAEPAGD